MSSSCWSGAETIILDAGYLSVSGVGDTILNYERYHDYDGPIYTYGNLLPDQVIVNVQRALQGLGYYAGDSERFAGSERIRQCACRLPAGLRIGCHGRRGRGDRARVGIDIEADQAK